MIKKKIIIIPIIALLLLAAGIIALTQESEYFNDLDMEPEFYSETDNEEPPAEEEVPPYYGYIYLREPPEWIRPVRWFKSNAGGLVIEEIPSKRIALRNEYAISIDYIHGDDLPGELLDFYDDNYLIEARILYKKGNPFKTQWVFRDYDGVVMLIAVFSEEDGEARTGFIEVYDDEGFISHEFNYFANNENNKIEYAFNENLLSTSSVYNWIEIRIPREIIIDEIIKNEITDSDIINGDRMENELAGFANDTGENEDEEIARPLDAADDPEYSIEEEILYDITGEYQLAYIDSFIYNRSMYLRMVERKYYANMELSLEDENVRLSLPSNIKKAQEDKFSSGARYNTLPEYFGAVTVGEDYKMVYATDDRSRILSQTLYDNEENIIWVITNTWQGDRIITSVKTEGEIILTSEYEYNSSGDRILERNFKDGNLERLVRAEGKTEIEELYLDNVIVLRAVWEDGRKITETRVRNN